MARPRLLVDPENAVGEIVPDRLAVARSLLTKHGLPIEFADVLDSVCAMHDAESSPQPLAADVAETLRRIVDDPVPFDHLAPIVQGHIEGAAYHLYREGRDEAAPEEVLNRALALHREGRGARASKRATRGHGGRRIDPALRGMVKRLAHLWERAGRRLSNAPPRIRLIDGQPRSTIARLAVEFIAFARDALALVDPDRVIKPSELLGILNGE